ncbi:putative leucine-rich repeat-containing protein DDB_G0290503 [Chaetodon trifascialis]|uniref:putative leucine-rich repeat-containing protein DDB_G0290503 n=1 Tax=Chaetodon trifascialis TaxID=109706 RepID=UPI003995400C
MELLTADMDVYTPPGHPGHSEAEHIIPKIPITLPEGIDPKNINITSIVIKTCTGMKEELTQLNRQLQQTTLLNSQLDNEAFGLRRDVRLLKLQLSACSSTASAITGSYQTQLHDKMKQLLETFDSDAFLILKTVALTREVKTLEKKVKHAANSTETTTERTVLQRELQEKNTELNAKMQQIERSHTNSSLIFQIISLQNQIWDLEQERRGETSLEPDKRILAVQEQLDRGISQLQGNGDAESSMLELISVHTKISMIQRLISVHIEKSRSNVAAYQRQWRQKVELLKKKILLLSRDEGNTELTKDILKLQAEVEHFRQLMSDTKKTTDSHLKELRAIMEEEKKRLEYLQKELEEREYAQAQLIMKIISIMKEVREMQVDEQDQTTSTSQATKCSGFEERYEQVKTEFEKKIAELNRTGHLKAALTLNVINLHDELRTLRELISTTEDPERISELQRQLEEKQEELNSKTAYIERLIANPQIILTILELQNEIWDVQKKADNETNVDRLKELQSKVDDLIAGIDDKVDGNTKLMLKIINLQNQVEQLQRQLSNLQMLQTTQATQFRHELRTKKNQLQTYVNELNEKNQTNARLILTAVDLQNQLRNLENERHHDNTTSSLTITQLREELRAKTEKHSRDQTRMEELQRKLQLKSDECSGFEERYEQVKTEFEQKIAELNRTGGSKAALTLNVINLHDELRTLKELISTTDDPESLSELQRQLEEKQEDLKSKTADIERLIANPKIILTIVELQDEMWDLQGKAANETDGQRLKELQNRVDGLISEIDYGDTKLMLKTISLQSQVQQLQRQLSDLQVFQTAQATQLTNDLAAKKKELQKYVSELSEKNQTNGRLILTVTDLHSQLRNLEKEKHKEGQTTTATITKLKEQLKEKAEEHTRDRAEIEALQNQLNQTEAQCSTFEQKLQDLQNDLDAKMKDLQSRSDTVTSLALQVSTLTMQLEELKRQLQNTESETKIQELQKIIDEKTVELAKKTEELKARSAQPQRLLQIITIQTEIEKLVNVAANDTDYNRISGLQDHLNDLISGIQDENNENTKLMFTILAQQDEIARLKKQEESQRQSELEKIKDLESELDDIRNQIKEKTLVLDSSDMRIANLSAQIMELHKKIKPLEEEISYLKEASTENVEELQKKLDLSKRQLQDSELRLKEADTKNFNSIMEIADLRTKLKKVQRQASRAAKQDINELEEQVKTQQKENKKLENANNDLKQEVKELKMCCNDANTQCDDLERQLQQSQEDADHLLQQLHDKDATVKQLQQELEEQMRENTNLQNEYSDLERRQNQTHEADYLLQQLYEKDASLNQLQQELEEKTREINKLQDDYNNLQNKLTEEDNTIYASKMTFDPNTANPRITLSADNTEMATGMEIQNVPDHPGRFDVALAVLGKNGFSTGRHYWEVSVAGKLCYHLGMASESAPRRGTISFSPANGFWTVVLNKQGQYKAIDKKPVLITVQTQPVTLGILLDIKKGQVSFYDAGARSHMYTFVGQRFTDNIYPFINFCVEDVESETPIVLLPSGSVDWIK